MIEFACPHCGHAALHHRDGRYRCEACGSSFPVEDGIPNFRDAGATFSWGVQQERMTDVLAEAGRLGWREAFLAMMAALPTAEARLVWNRTYGLKRLAVALHLPLHPEARVLDFGSGWGTISRHLSHYCREVVSVDQMPHHLRWLQRSAEEQGITNITPVLGGDTRFLPFATASFDAVILNGVFEWVASNTPGDPRAVQLRFLEEVRRVLKPDGLLYMGIENRWNYRYFKGIPEGHIDMKYGALLPRSLTDLYLRIRRGARYREYTYTLFGYRKLFRQAGFRRWRFFGAWPHYGSIDHVLPLEARDDAPAPYRLESSNRFARPPASYFSKSFTMTVSSGARRATVLDRVLVDAASTLGWTLPVPVREVLYTVRTTGKAVSQVRMPDGESRLVSIGLAPSASRGLRRQHEAIARLSAGSAAAVAARLPEPGHLGEVAGFVYAVDPLAEGRNGGAVLEDGAARRVLCDDAFEFVTTLGVASGVRRRVDGPLYGRLFGQPLEALRRWFTSAEWREHGPWLDDVGGAVRRAVMGRELLLVPRHGDFVPQNCVLSADGTIATVVDWEMFEPESLPLYDWVTFLGTAHRPTVRAGLRFGGGAREIKFPGYPDIFLEDELEAELLRYLDALSLDRALLRPLLLMWWVYQVKDWTDAMFYHPEWKRNRINELVPRLRALAEELGAGAPQRTAADV